MVVEHIHLKSHAMPNKLLLIILVSAILLSSCHPTMHFADRANSPGFTEQGEFKAVASIKPQTNAYVPDTLGIYNIATSDFAPEFDLAYALTNHFAITAGYTSVVNCYTTEGQADAGWGGSTDSSIGGNVNMHGAELGAGYFGKGPKAFKYGIYGSIGIGNIKRDGIILPNFNYKSRYFKYSIQPEFGLSPNNSKIFSFTFGTRLTGIKYYGFRSNDPLTKYAVGYYSPKYGQNVTNQLYYYFEPYLNIEVGYKYVKFNLQSGATLGLGEVSGDMGQTPYISAGILFHFRPNY